MISTLYRLWAFILLEWRTRNPIETSDNLFDTLRNCLVWSLVLIFLWATVYFLEDLLIGLAQISSYEHRPTPQKKIEWRQSIVSVVTCVHFVGMWYLYSYKAYKRLKMRHDQARKLEA